MAEEGKNISEAEIILALKTLTDISDKLHGKILPEGYHVVIAFQQPCKTKPCKGDCCRTFRNCDRLFNDSVILDLVK